MSGSSTFVCMEKFGKWENIKQEEKKRGKFPTKRGPEGEIAKGI